MTKHLTYALFCPSEQRHAYRRELCGLGCSPGWGEEKQHMALYRAGGNAEIPNQQCAPGSQRSEPVLWMPGPNTGHSHVFKGQGFIYQAALFLNKQLCRGCLAKDSSLVRTQWCSWHQVSAAQGCCSVSYSGHNGP